MHSNHRRPARRGREYGRRPSPGRHTPAVDAWDSDRAGDSPGPRSPHPRTSLANGSRSGMDSTPFPPPRVNGEPERNLTGSNGIAVLAPPDAAGTAARVSNGRDENTEKTVRRLWQASESAVPHSPLRPSSSHSMRQMTARRWRSGMWTTVGLVAVAAGLTIGLLTLVGGSSEGAAQARASVADAAAGAGDTVSDSLATLEALRAGSPFSPELVASISALGEASRNLVESAGTLPTDDPSLAEIRMSATALAGRVSRLGETFGAAFSYRGQVQPHLALPALDAPLDVANLTGNTTTLTDWQFRLEQAASTRPGQPRLLQNQQALAATLPYIAVHRQAYTDAVGNGQSEQAQAALSQIDSLVSAISQDFDRAYREIGETAQVEIQSLSADLQNLFTGT